MLRHILLAYASPQRSCTQHKQVPPGELLSDARRGVLHSDASTMARAMALLLAALAGVAAAARPRTTRALALRGGS